MEKNKDIVLQSIKDTLHRVVPTGTKVVLFGSQARGDAHEDSDWDILIILDKSKIETNDYDNISYPLRELGWN